MSEKKTIVDRVAADGHFMFDPHQFKIGRKVRKAHYFNSGAETPLCSPSQFSGTKNSVSAHLPSAEYTHVESESGEMRNACGYCLSLVLHGVDMQANHARQELGQPIVAADLGYETPYTFGR